MKTRKPIFILAALLLVSAIAWRVWPSASTVDVGDGTLTTYSRLSYPRVRVEAPFTGSGVPVQLKNIPSDLYDVRVFPPTITYQFREGSIVTLKISDGTGRDRVYAGRIGREWVVARGPETYLYFSECPMLSVEKNKRYSFTLEGIEALETVRFSIVLQRGGLRISL